MAERLAIEPGSAVMKTEYVFLADGQPIQSSVSYEPLDLTEGAEIELPEEGRYTNTGVITRMDAIDVHITRVSEEVTIRPPRAAESDLLQIEPGVHVFHIRRTFSTDERPVETADIIIPGDRYSLTYEFRVTDEDDPATV
ncbi:UTRA domain-containing protein [Streptomyces sp. TLI_185]|uniref:UTRA domain-containing protein n=1 Tax=Streptomyces sp. TLI_185 TaxID=2485151 RepID=UPI0021A2B3F3|nr:UTRA domain-containing protein [Streptomyces sp. TLI_185]